MSEERITDIEATLAFQERTLAELNGVVYEQQRQIDNLTAALKELAEKLDTQRNAGGDGEEVADERPPHY